MSWDGWICSMKAGDSQGESPVEEAAICGTTAGQESVWASSPGLANITVDEIKKLVCSRSEMPINGCYLGGKKCRLLRDRMDEEGCFSLDLKTSSDGSDSGPVNVCVGRTKTAVVIAFGKKDAPGGKLGDKVFKTTECLRKSNM
ncbi:profilin-1 [Cheilinus undulatus]|uniref:profilin-1 n=1 Tax=Cheilinus undulatus TaxID=241271 RepID=UPI001BD6804B|nr:profilin-1 [Cheilinus undulatus]